MMSQSAQVSKANSLRKLHHAPPILVLPNAWDVASAKIFEQAGFPAVATTSAGVAWALGYADGECIGRGEMLEVVGRIARALAVPVTADMEAGYGPSPGDAAETVRGVVAAGAVGLNLEDTASHSADGAELTELPLQVERIAAAREAANSSGVPVVINARTDVFLHAIGTAETRFEHAVERANAYKKAGADCLFVPGVADADTIGKLAKAIAGPINILAGAQTPPLAALERLGVARVSVGSGPCRATLALVRNIAAELRGPGTFTFAQNALPHPEVNRLIEPSRG